MAINKVIYGDEVLIDLTGDTVTKENILSGVTAHDKSGAAITGECTFDSDTTKATVAAGEILVGRTAYARKVQITGTMPNNEGVNGTISEKTGQFSIPTGFHDGSGKVSIATDEQAKLIPANIKSGVTVLGVIGEYNGETVTAQNDKVVTPTVAKQTIIPDDGYDYLSQVEVSPIPRSDTPNSAGGTTVEIG